MSAPVSYIDLLIEMISIPALSRKEEKRADFLEETLKQWGHKVFRLHNNLLLGHPTKQGKSINLLLNSHMDTVAPVEGWESDPHTPLVENGKITGLGSNDAGASVVAMIATYHDWVDKYQEELNLMLLISAEEEVSGKHGIEEVLPRLGTLDGVIVGEPTGMQPAVAERGLMVLDGEMKGKAGHAARSEGENAIYKALLDVEAIKRLSFERPSVWLPDPGAQVTMISAGTGHNVVPDVCRYVVDVRSNDQYGNEELLKLISGVCQGEMVPRSTRLHPSSLDGGHLLMKTILECELDPFGSSTLSDMALVPFPAIKMGPGNSARSHTAGEYILQSELEEGVKGYNNFLSTIGKIIKKNKEQ